MIVAPAHSGDRVRSRRRVIAAAIALFIFTLLWRFLAFTGFTNDHYASLALAQQMLLGDRPIRDFSDPGWPATYLVSAAAWLLFGNAIGTEWAVTAIAFALAAACTVVAARRLAGSLPIAILVTLLEVLIYPRTYSYPKLLPYAAGAWAMLALAARPSSRPVLLMAAIIAAAFLLRHDHGLLIGVASALCLALASRTDGWRTAVRRVTMLTASAAVLLVPWMVFVALNGGLVSYVETAVEFARAEANASNLKAWPTLTLLTGKPVLGLALPSRPLAQIEWTRETSPDVRDSLERRYGLEYVRESDGARFYYVHNPAPENIRALEDDPHVAGTTGLGRVQRPIWREFLASVSPLRLAPALHAAANADAWLYWLFWALPAVCGVVALRRSIVAHERWPGELAAVAGLVLLAFCVDAAFLRDILRTRFPDAVVLAALLGAWALGVCWTDRWRSRSLQGLVRIATVVVLGISVTAIAHVSELSERLSNTGIGEGTAGVRARITKVSQLLASPHRQDLAPPSRYSQALMPFFKYLDRCTVPSDRLIVTSELPDILVLAGRPFAGDGVVFGAWYSSATHQDRSIAHLRERPALFVLHMDDYGAFRSRFDMVDAYLSQEYEPMAEIPVEGAGSIRILAQRSRRAVRIDPETGWPCYR